MSDEDFFLFNQDEINNLEWSKIEVGLDNLNNTLKLRPLRLDDYDRGHLKVLSQLTSVGDVSKEEYEERFKLMKESKLVKVVVIEDTNCNRITASATLLCEPKFTHHCSWIGHVQDVVVDDAYRGKKLGKILVNCLRLLAVKIGAYKVDLDCADHNTSYYKSLGFEQETGRANYMVLRF